MLSSIDRVRSVIILVSTSSPKPTTTNTKNKRHFTTETTQLYSNYTPTRIHELEAEAPHWMIELKTIQSDDEKIIKVWNNQTL